MRRISPSIIRWSPTRCSVFLIYGTTPAEVKGLNAFPKADWPTNIPLLYLRLSHHGGTGDDLRRGDGRKRIAAVAGRAITARAGCCGSFCSVLPLPYIANTAGWMTAEIGRQPWLVYGLMRTTEAIRSTSTPATVCSRCWDSWGCTCYSGILFLSWCSGHRGRSGGGSGGTTA